MLMEGDVGAFRLQQTRYLVEQAGRRLRASPDFGGLSVSGNHGSRVQRLHLSVIGVARAIFAAEYPPIAALASPTAANLTPARPLSRAMAANSSSARSESCRAAGASVQVTLSRFLAA